MAVKVVNSGIDSLMIGFNIAEYRDPEAFKVLIDAKVAAGEKLFGGKGAPVGWYDKELVVLASGTKGYAYVLKNGDVRLCVAEKAEGGRVYPEILVTPKADYLWREGHVKAVQEIQEWLETWAVVVGNKVSRCDLCIDIQMDLPKIDLATDAVTRARGKAAYYEACEHYVGGRRDTGYRMGSGALVARIYDKSLEIMLSDKEWFKPIWSARGWDGEGKVTRVEFQARRDFLKKMSVNSFTSLCENLADMWRYYTKDWLTIRVPTCDSHRHRWPITEWWQTIQNGFTLFGEANGVLPYRQRQFRYERLMRQAMGVLVSAMAVDASRFGLEYTFWKMGKEIQEWLDSPDRRHEVIERMASVASFSGRGKPHLVDAAVHLGGRIESVEPSLGKEEY